VNNTDFIRIAMKAMDHQRPSALILSKKIIMNGHQLYSNKIYVAGILGGIDCEYIEYP